MFQAVKISFRIRRFVSLSSTTRTGISRISRKRVSMVSRSGGALCSGIAKENFVPTPTSLSMTSFPPISSTNCCEIASPNPVPPKRRVVDASTCVKASSTVASLSAGIPIPVSSTRKRSLAQGLSGSGLSGLGLSGLGLSRSCVLFAGASSSLFSAIVSQTTSILTSPDSVNLIPLPSRLINTCRNRPLSPSQRSGKLGSTRQVNSNPFSDARSAKVRPVFSTKSRNENGAVSSSSFRASILEKSRISFSSRSSAPADSRTIDTYSLCSYVRLDCDNNSDMPMIAFIGVRISWLMLAKNSLLDWLALSA